MKHLRGLIDRASKGDESAVPEIRRVFADPEIATEEKDLFVRLLGGHAAVLARYSLLAVVCGENLALREGLNQKYKQVYAELAGPEPSPIERLLAERAALCWLDVHSADTRYYQSMGEMTLRQAEYHHRTRDRSHRRYLSALRSLAAVRKLAVPAIQVNVGAQQVNVAGP